MAAADAMSLEHLLAAHRQTLSELYTSLSPDPSPSLASNARELHAALTALMATQRQHAQDEVDKVERKVADGWRRVADWRTALGEPDGKSRGQGPLLVLVDEVEGVLAGMRSRMEERGKLMVTLHRRLAALATTLGREFLTIEPENVEAGWENLDLRLERMSQLEREVMRCEAELAHRRALINANVNEIFALRAELGIHQNSTSPTSATHASDGANAPIPDPFDEAILSHLGVGEGREHKELSATSENLARVEAKRKWLEEEKDHRNGVIQATYDKLFPLWTMLGVSEAEMEDFVNRWMGSTSDVVNAYQTELNRMLTLKRSNLSAFIMREREALTYLWDALFLSPQQRLATFPPFTISVAPTRVWNAAHGVEEEVVNDNVSEELLVAHERERERVENEVERARPVLERLTKYFGVVEELRELEASAADPSRLLGKSTRGDPGRLLREEKARKRVAKEKPKLELELRQFIPSWEQENGRPFLVNGKRFLDELDQKMAEAAEKETKKRTKTTTASSTTRPAPLRAQPTGSSSAGSMVPIKRQMTGASAKAPAAKRQTPMTTGGGNSSTLPLCDIGNARTAGLSASVGPLGGMRIPAGWGGADAAATATATNQHYSGVPIAHQITGFKPRTSALSATSSGLSSSMWSGRGTAS